MRPLHTWRTATAVLPRRAALRLLAASAVTTTVAACSGKSAPGFTSVALGKFAAGTWTVAIPKAHYSSAVITVAESGTWTGKFANSDDPSETGASSGTWALSGQSLQITFEQTDSAFESPTGTALNVPLTVSGDAKAAFTWQYEAISQMQASYVSATRTLTLDRHFGRGTTHQTITAIRT
ncbi:hypothetical protein ACFYNO_01880 [Kitasatospora sp. NPDC006697]|uniref:hypothetical protein n=1 Tax=Kitasatospora sp. NPDC006697 TaxID=3364020 RepID=UPI0036B80979